MINCGAITLCYFLCLGVWSSTYYSHPTYDTHLVIKDLKDDRPGGRLTFVRITTDDNTALYYYYCISGFTKKAADLACHELGYTHAQEYRTVKNLQ